jgi:NAD-dependent SIR2 family protein deacetylase
MSELEPVLRCDSCHILIRVSTIHKIGSCPDCGNRRMRNLLVLKNEQEMQQIKDWGFHDLAAKFEEVGEEVAGE